jgi:hypothetical protein
MAADVAPDARRRSDGTPAEHRIYMAVAVLAVSTYVLVGLILPTHFRTPRFFFGFNQFKHLGFLATATLCLLGVAVILLYHWKRRPADDLVDRLASVLFSRKTLLAGVGVLSAVLFFGLRSNFLNPDSIDLTWKLPRDVALKGAHVTHDEMWELYLHSRFWHYAHRYAGWSVTRSYQVLSSLAGGLFVPLLLLYARLLAPRGALALAGLVASGGFMQLFFGDPENYTLTAVLVLVYLYASAAHLRGRCAVFWPSALLAVAITFHLLAGWLLPSLAYLHLLQLRKRSYGAVALAAAAFLSIVGLTLLFFHFHGLPLRDLYRESHAFGHGGDILAMLARPKPLYYLGLLNLLFLLAPAVWLAAPLLALKRVALEPLNVHLLLASAFMLLFMFSWKATLGVYSDWNLFANAAIPLSALVAYNLSRIETLRHRGAILLALAWVFAMHSYCWIVSNHFRA